MSTPANVLTASILIEIPKLYPAIRLWRSNRLDAMVPGRGGEMRRVQAGIDGQGDIQGIQGPMGRFISIEVKAGKDRQSIVQAGFQAFVQAHGGLYILARSLEDVVKALEVG